MAIIFHSNVHLKLTFFPCKLFFNLSLYLHLMPLNVTKTPNKTLKFKKSNF